MRFLIRADGSRDLGLGHLSRCRTLARALREEGAEADLWTRDDPAARAFLEGEPACFSPTPEAVDRWPDADACIVDLYRYDDEFYRAVGGRIRRIAIFDDVAFRVPARVSAVINGNVYARPEDYPAGVLALAGAAYHPLRPDLCGLRQRPGADRVLLCLGGSDPEGHTEAALLAVLGATGRAVDVLLGHGSEAVGRGRPWSDPRVAVHRAVADVGPLLQAACWALCGAGGMLYELAHLGVPSAALLLAENQRRTAEAFAAAGAAVGLGPPGEVPAAELRERLRALDRSELLRRSLAAKASALVDGLGGRRAARALLPWALGAGGTP